MMHLLCHLDDNFMHVLLKERKSQEKGLSKFYSLGCYLSCTIGGKISES